MQIISFVISITARELLHTPLRSAIDADTASPRALVECYRPADIRYSSSQRFVCRNGKVVALFRTFVHSVAS